MIVNNEVMCDTCGCIISDDDDVYSVNVIKDYQVNIKSIKDMCGNCYYHMLKGWYAV